jgi:hypothetical protein
MADELKNLSPAYLLLVLQFIVPGFLILHFRSIFIVRRNAIFKDNIAFYITVSLIYGFLLIPAVNLIGSPLIGHWRWFLWLILSIIAPILLGVLFGILTQRDFFGDTLRRFKLRPVSPFPTAWDEIFGRLGNLREARYIIVTMNDGAQIAGLYYSQSRASASAENRDIFLEKLYQINGTEWTAWSSNDGVLISAKDIRFIEFVKPGALSDVE